MLGIMNDITELANHQIRYKAYMQCPVCLVVADGHLILRRLLWVCMGAHTHLLPLRSSKVLNHKVKNSVHRYRRYWLIAYPPCERILCN